MDPFCRCQGGKCEHHSKGQPCPNDPVPPIEVIINPQTGTPVAGSACGLCEECREASYAEDEDEMIDMRGFHAPSCAGAMIDVPKDDPLVKKATEAIRPDWNKN